MASASRTRLQPLDFEDQRVRNAQEQVLVDVRILLDEIGNELRMINLIRAYEVDLEPATKIDGGEATATYYNRRHDRCVRVWVGGSYSSSRDDQLVCKAQAWGARHSGKPGAYLCKRLSDQRSISVDHDEIKATVKALLKD